jgi:hypothetical protein
MYGRRRASVSPSYRQGGIKQIREHGWRVDVELPRDPRGRRRRVSKTVGGTIDDAEAALDLFEPGDGIVAELGDVVDARLAEYGSEPGFVVADAGGSWWVMLWSRSSSRSLGLGPHVSVVMVRVVEIWCRRSLPGAIRRWLSCRVFDVGSDY